MRNRQASRNHDTSPYGNSAVHLIPPMESNWHRSISDSAIHQSLCQNQQQDSNHLTTHSPLTLSPTVQRKISNAQHISKVHNSHMTNNLHNHHHHHHQHNNHHDNNGSSAQDIRSRSSTALPRLPGINIYPTQNHPDSIQIPIPSNTGSLPDLTSVGYPSMYPATLDQEYDPNGQNHSYCPSPLGTSPSSLSPTSAIQNHHQHHPHPRANSFSGGMSGAGGGGGGNGVGGYPIPTSLSNSGSVSPTGSGISCSPNAVSANAINTVNMVNAVVNHSNNGSGIALNNGLKSKKTKPPTISSQPFLSVPDSNRYSFMSKVNNAYDTSQQQQQQSPQQQHQQQSQQSPQQQQQQQQRIPNLEQINYDNFTQISDGLASPNQNSPESILYGNMSPQIMSDYRTRPSPGSSPGLALVNNPDSNSSAPCSPVSHSVGSNNGQSYEKYPTSDVYVQNTLPQYLEHITLDWTTLVQSLVESGCTLTAQVQGDTDFTTNQMVFGGFDETYLMNNGLGIRTHTTQGNGQGHQTVTSQTNQLHSVNCQNMQNMQNTNMNSLFNGTSEPLLSLTNTQSLIEPQTPTIPEIVFTDYSTRDDFEADLGLGHMDFQSIQMLSDASTMIDPMDEDSFRRDLQ
uniref:Transducer of regulated CREB activity middle domain-containing protein n=1 Tax=Anopheles atroparvus TaxID=41427 RepID=A0AAG5DRM8_ANOAO